MNDPSVAYSRPQKTAELLGNLAVDRNRFTEKRVLLTGEADVLATANGRMCLLDALSLLIRTCRFVDVALPSAVPELDAEVRKIAKQIAFGQDIGFRDRPALATYDAI